MKRETPKSRGYVLVLTLAVLVLLAGVLVSSARLAMQHANRAKEAQRELQRWVGVASCRRAILPRAEEILMQQEAVRNSPMPRHRAAVRLGEFIFDLTIADEQAKANVNALLETAAPAVVENRIRQALSGTGLAAAVVLHPQQQGDRYFMSGLGQIFEGVAPDELMAPRAGKSPAELISCWGSGTINPRRASEASLRLALSPPWSTVEISRLIQARNAMFSRKLSKETKAATPAPLPRDPLLRLLQTAQIRNSPARLTLDSACHSIWIITRDGRREWYDLAVMDASDALSPRVMSFSW